MSKNILLISPATFKELTSAHTNTDEKLIRPEIKSAQDIHLMPILGSILFNKILTLIEAGTLYEAPNTVYGALVNEYVIDVLINLVMSELPDATSYQFTNKGVTAKTGQDAQALDYSILNSVKKKYKNRADAYAKLLRDHIIANPSLYPEYWSGGGADLVTPVNKTYTCPIYIGAGTKIEIKPQQGYNSNDIIYV